MDTFLQAQGDGDQGDVIMPHDQPLYRSAATVSRSPRTIFGEHQIKASVYRSSPDLKSAVILRPVNDRLGLTTDRYSPLLQEFSLLFCCEQAFHGSADACSQVFGHQLSVDTLQKVSRRLVERADQFLQTLEAPPPVEEGELLVMTAGDDC